MYDIKVQNMSTNVSYAERYVQIYLLSRLSRRKIETGSERPVLTHGPIRLFQYWPCSKPNINSEFISTEQRHQYCTG